MSFVDESSVRGFVEQMVIEVTKRTRPDRPMQQLPFPVFTYEEALERYGSDKPDLRYGMELIDLGAALPATTGFKVFDDVRASGGRIRAIRVPGKGGVARSEIARSVTARVASSGSPCNQMVRSSRRSQSSSHQSRLRRSGV
jgi:aspartyl-tRNA synthetase